MIMMPYRRPWPSPQLTGQTDFRLGPPRGVWARCEQTRDFIFQCLMALRLWRQRTGAPLDTASPAGRERGAGIAPGPFPQADSTTPPRCGGSAAGMDFSRPVTGWLLNCC
jgi:hypothetical protein